MTRLLPHLGVRLQADGQEQVAAGHPNQLPHHRIRLILVDVLQHVRREDQVKGVVGVRQVGQNPRLNDLHGALQPSVQLAAGGGRQSAIVSPSSTGPQLYCLRCLRTFFFSKSGHSDFSTASDNSMPHALFPAGRVKNQKPVIVVD